MNTYAKFTKFTPARVRVTAVLTAVFLAALSVATALRAVAQTATTQPSTPGVVWIVTDTKGYRTVSYLGADGTAVPAGNLGPVSSSSYINCPVPPCIKIVFACLC
jgi:hypothetical protein